MDEKDLNSLNNSHADNKMQSATALTLEERTQTLGPDTFANLMPRFEDVHLISKLQSERLMKGVLRNLSLYPGDGLGYGLKDASLLTGSLITVGSCAG